MSEKHPNSDLLQLTAEIISSHVANNTVDGNELSSLIQKVYQTLSELGISKTTVSDRLEPAVPIKKSIHPDYLVCLEDGKKLKMLKRHLKTAYNMTPEQYKERWNLPSDYPMVAPNYANQRSQLAKNIGLGTQRRKTV